MICFNANAWWTNKRLLFKLESFIVNIWVMPNRKWQWNYLDYLHNLIISVIIFICVIFLKRSERSVFNFFFFLEFLICHHIKGCVNRTLWCSVCIQTSNFQSVKNDILEEHSDHRCIQRFRLRICQATLQNFILSKNIRFMQESRQRNGTSKIGWWSCSGCDQEVGRWQYWFFPTICWWNRGILFALFWQTSISREKLSLLFALFFREILVRKESLA